jgi:hypothetical protein
VRHWSHPWQKKKKKQEKSKLWHHEPPGHTKLLHATLHWENRRAHCQTPAPTCKGDIQQTNKWANKHHVVFSQPPLG